MRLRRYNKMEQDQKKQGRVFDEILDTILKTIEENKTEMIPGQSRQFSIRDKARMEATKKLVPKIEEK
jgi:hypothetical protein